MQGLDMKGLSEDVNKHRDLYEYERAEKFTKTKL